MANTAERGTIQPREQGRIDKILHSPMSRRTFIKRAGAVLLSAEIAAACGVPAGATATAHPTTTGAESFPVTSFVPESIKPVDIPTLSSDTFNKVFGYYSDTTEVNIGGKQETVKSLASEASNIWNDGNLTSITAGRNAVEGLRLALSASELSGNTGTVDFSKIFKGLNIELPRFSISTLTNGKDTEEASNVSPSNLTLRKGMDMTVVGIDDTKGNAMVAFSDTLRKPNNSPTMYFVSIPVEASSGQLSFSELLARNGATYDSKTHEILYTNGKTLPIYKLDTTLSQSLEQETGAYFVDTDFLKSQVQGKPVPEAAPIVYQPDTSIAPEGSKINELSDGRVVIVNSKGEILARSMALENGTRQWVGNKESGQSFLLEYTPREYADAIGIKIGSQSGGWLFNGDFAEKKALFTAESSIATVDSGIYWSDIEPEKGVFDFTWADQQVNEWLKDGIKIRGHALVFPTTESTLPDWLKNGNFSKTELTQIMVNHIKQVVGHFKGRISEWVVVNEPYFAGVRENDMFYKIIGPNYIDLAFKAAREADPSAKLIFNDTDNEHGGTSGATLDLPIVQKLHSEDLIDAVGLEMHMGDMSWVPGGIPTAADVTSTIKSYGIPAVVTEFDYELNNYNGTEAQKLQRQADIYQRLIQASLAANVKEFTFWCLEDTENPSGEPTMFKDALHPKPAYEAVLTVFKNAYEQKIKA